MNEHQTAAHLYEAILRYGNLLQTDLVLLNLDGTILLSSDQGPSESGTAPNVTLFHAPLDQCIDRPIQLKGKHDYDLSPYYYCLPVMVGGIPRFFVAISGFDVTRLPRECALVAAGLSELLIQWEKSLPNPLQVSHGDAQTQFVKSVCQNLPAAQMKLILQTMKIEPTMLRAVICAEFSFSPPNYFERLGSLDYEILCDNTTREILQYVRRHAYLNRSDIAAMADPNELVIIKSFPIHADVPKAYRTLDVICGRLLEELSQFGIFEVHMAHGNLTTDCSGLCSSYAEAKSFLEMGKEQYPEIPYYTVNNLMLDLISKDVHPQIEAKVLLPILRALENSEGELQWDLLKCAETMVDCCMSYSAAAQKLQLHRNTLHTRMERFCALTGLDPLHNFYDAVAVKMAAILWNHRKDANRGGSRL